MDDFLLRAILAGGLVSLISAPLGCLVVWRRMSYYGATIAHGGLLGVAGGILLGINLSLAVLVMALILTFLLILLERAGRLPVDTLLGIIAHVALAAGVLAASQVNNGNVDLMSYLFGDILSVGWNDILLFALLAVSGLALLIYYRDQLLLFCLHEDMAAAEGIKTRYMNVLFLVLLALTIAIAMKIIGILLITAMLIIPAATARVFAREPEQMALLATGISLFAVIAGLGVSYWLDSQSGPTIIMVMALCFFLSLSLKAR